MPELIEVELYASALRPLIGHRLVDVELADPDYLRPPGTPRSALAQLVGAELTMVHRHGKLLLAEFGEPGDRPRLGMRFGMTGRLLVDGAGPIERLVYSSPRDDAAWDRVVFRFDLARVAIRDPRRLGSVELDPPLDGLGPDAAAITTAELRRVMPNRRAPLKALLLNQSVIAGLGNLLVDETLWRCGLDPRQPAGDLDDSDLRRLARAIRSTVAVLTRRGGSHTGDTFEARTPGALCPRDGHPLRREPIGGRTTIWCPAHQH